MKRFLSVKLMIPSEPASYLVSGFVYTKQSPLFVIKSLHRGDFSGSLSPIHVCGRSRQYSYGACIGARQSEV